MGLKNYPNRRKAKAKDRLLKRNLELLYWRQSQITRSRSIRDHRRRRKYR